MKHMHDFDANCPIMFDWSAASLWSVRHTMSRRLRVATDLGRFQLPGQQAMSKLILTCNLRLRGGRSTVARMDWVPSYFGSRNGHAWKLKENPWRMLQNDGDIRDLGLVVELHACIQQEQWWVMKLVSPLDTCFIPFLRFFTSSMMRTLGFVPASNSVLTITIITSSSSSPCSCSCSCCCRCCWCGWWCWWCGCWGFFLARWQHTQRQPLCVNGS